MSISMGLMAPGKLREEFTTLAIELRMYLQQYIHASFENVIQCLTCFIYAAVMNLEDGS